jgi:predicted RNase H-like nuclease (RuvC/YqgF family)
MLLGNNNRYDEDEIKLKAQIKEMQTNIENLKKDNEMLTKEMEVAVETDKEIRKQLHVKSSVNRMKRDNFK